MDVEDEEAAEDAPSPYSVFTTIRWDPPVVIKPGFQKFGSFRVFN